MSAQVVHGGGLDAAIARYGGDRADWLDLSTGINPMPWPIPNISAEAYQRLPDKGAHKAMLGAARQAYGVPEDGGIVAANGTQALIEMLPHVLPCDRVAVVGPTYEEHKLCWTKAGRHVDMIASVEELPTLSNALVVVNPNNPDGRVLTREKLIELAEQMALRHGWLIVDEAFADFDPSQSLAPFVGDREVPENVIVLRSFGKFYGLAGVRLGFAIGPYAIAIQLEHLFGPWSVNGPALEIGTKALADDHWGACMRLELVAKADSVKGVLLQSGMKILGGTPLFVLADHPNAKAIYESLCRQHILTRPFPLNPTWLRFGICGDDNDLQRLQQALGEIL